MDSYIYWNRRGSFSTERFKAAVQDCRKVCQSERFSSQLAGWDGVGDPIFTETQLSFNGVEELAGETFSIEREGTPGIYSCKTEGLPYDAAVRCCLLILRHYVPEEIEISDDGRDKDKWINAQDFVNEVLQWDDEFHGDFVK